MARPRHEKPTPAELNILRIVWQHKTSVTVREVWEVMRDEPRRAYTSVMSLMNVMVDKGLLTRRPHGKAFIYSAAVTEKRALGDLVGDLVRRAFEGSASALVAHLLEKTDENELAEIRKTLAAHERQANQRER